MKTTIVIAKNKWQNPTKKEIFSVLFLVFEDNGFITHDQRPIPTLFLPPFAFSFSFASSVFVDAIYPCRSSFRTICAMLGVLFVSLLCVDSQPTLFFLFFFSFYIIYYGLGLGLARAIGREGAFGCLLLFFFFFFVSTWFMTFVIVIRIFDYCGFQPCICIRALFFQSLIDTLYSLHLLTGPEFEAYVFLCFLGRFDTSGVASVVGFLFS